MGSMGSMGSMEFLKKGNGTALDVVLPIFDSHLQ